MVRRDVSSGLLWGELLPGVDMPSSLAASDDGCRVQALQHEHEHTRRYSCDSHGAGMKVMYKRVKAMPPSTMQ